MVRGKTLGGKMFPTRTVAGKKTGTVDGDNFLTVRRQQSTTFQIIILQI